jgi:tRNA-Thr(GGU) m(6)t(6)A37 methyltransferase TsaA
MKHLHRSPGPEDANLTGVEKLAATHGDATRSRDGERLWTKEVRVADDEYVIRPVGWVESPLLTRDMAPMQGDEGAPDAWLVFEERVRPALQGLQVGAEAILLTWLDRSDRDVLAVHPRGDASRPLTGVFQTRAPDRPNPIGLHRVQILAIDGLRVQVRNLEALDGTPIVDMKAVLGRLDER